VVVVIIAATAAAAAATEQSSQSPTDDHSIETTKDATDRIPTNPTKKRKTKNSWNIDHRSSVTQQSRK
jgi:hypothetical protein